MPGRSSGWPFSLRFSTSARTRYLLPACTSGLMKTTLPVNRAVARRPAAPRRSPADRRSPRGRPRWRSRILRLAAGRFESPASRGSPASTHSPSLVKQRDNDAVDRRDDDAAGPPRHRPTARRPDARRRSSWRSAFRACCGRSAVRRDVWPAGASGFPAASRRRGSCGRSTRPAPARRRPLRGRLLGNRTSMSSSALARAASRCSSAASLSSCGWRSSIWASSCPAATNSPSTTSTLVSARLRARELECPRSARRGRGEMVT